MNKYIASGKVILFSFSPNLTHAEKVKAYLIRGARQLPGMASQNVMSGWGALCVADSLLN